MNTHVKPIFVSTIFNEGANLTLSIFHEAFEDGIFAIFYMRTLRIYNALVHVIYSVVSGQYSFTILAKKNKQSVNNKWSN